MNRRQKIILGVLAMGGCTIAALLTTRMLTPGTPAWLWDGLCAFFIGSEVFLGWNLLHQARKYMEEHNW